MIFSPSIRNDEERPISILPHLAEIPVPILLGLAVPELGSVLKSAKSLTVDVRKPIATVAFQAHKKFTHAFCSLINE
jgi:hypothetical protein